MWFLDQRSPDDVQSSHTNLSYILLLIVLPDTHPIPSHWYVYYIHFPHPMNVTLVQITLLYHLHPIYGQCHQNVCHCNIWPSDFHRIEIHIHHSWILPVRGSPPALSQAVLYQTDAKDTMTGQDTM